MKDTKYAKLRRKLDQSFRKYELTKKIKYKNAYNNRLKEMKEYLASSTNGNFSKNIHIKLDYL